MIVRGCAVQAVVWTDRRMSVVVGCGREVVDSRKITRLETFHGSRDYRTFFLEVMGSQ